jgi:hypothetical protein
MTHLRADTVPISDAELAAGYSNGTGECIMPVPSNAGTPPLSLMRLAGRKADCKFSYRDRDGGLIGHVLRWDAAENFRKEFRPVTYWHNTNGGEWRARIWPGLRPLYGLDKLAARPNAIVLVVEGEKVADAVDSGPLAHVLRWGDADLIAVTWPGGSNAANCADFLPLAARDVIIVPDADAPGERAADALVPNSAQGRGQPAAALESAG